jgi:hypothetical protein
MGLENNLRKLEDNHCPYFMPRAEMRDLLPSTY